MQNMEEIEIIQKRKKDYKAKNSMIISSLQGIREVIISIGLGCYDKGNKNTLANINAIEMSENKMKDVSSKAEQNGKKKKVEEVETEE